MGIRRLCDLDNRSLSLVRFLEHIKNNPSLISRKAYGNLCGGSSDKYLENLSQDRRACLRELLANEEYDNLIGKNMLQPDSNDIQKEIDELRNRAKSVTKYATKRIAHLDKKPPTTSPTFDDIDVTIDHIINLMKKYFHLLKATAMDFEPHFQYDWLAPLRVIWLPETAVQSGGFK